MASWDSLPKDVQHYIISFVQLPTIITIIPLVCKEWRSKFWENSTLERLNLSTIIVPKAPNKVLNTLLSRFKAAKGIDFKRWGENVNQATLKIIYHFPQICALSFEGCKKLTFEHIEELSSKLPMLRKIDLRYSHMLFNRI